MSVCFKFRQLFFHQTLFELVESWVSYRKNKNDELFETQCSLHILAGIGVSKIFNSVVALPSCAIVCWQTHGLRHQTNSELHIARFNSTVSRLRTPTLRP